MKHGTEQARGLAVLRRNNGAFNYGDFARCVPKDILRDHGIANVETIVSDIAVCRNDSLLPD